MISKAILIHDSYTTPAVGWYLWMQTEFPKKNIQVFAPNMPTPVGQSYLSWRVLFQSVAQHLGPETVIIAHGTGALFALRYISEQSIQIGGMILIAPYVEHLPNQGYASVNESFLSTQLDWSAIHKNCQAFSVIAANRDPFVPLAFSKNVSDLCGGTYFVLEHDGHLLGDRPELPELWKSLELISAPRPTQEQKDLSALTSELALSGINLDIKALEPQKQDDQFTTIDSLPTVTGFYDDIQKTISSGDAASMANMLAEERAKEQERAAAKARLIINGIYLALGIVMLGVGTAFILKKDTISTPINSLRDTSTLRAEKIIPLKLPSEKVAAIQAIEKSRLENPGSNKSITLVTLTDVSERPISFQNFMDIIGAEVPVDVRTTTKNYVFGYYQLEKSEPFLLMQVDSFDRGFAGMRAWEPLLARDLYRTMIDSQSGFTREAIETGAFTDIEIANKKMRELLLARTRSVTTQVTSEVRKSENEFPRIINYETKMGGTFYSDRIIWKTLPPEISNLMKGDILLIPATTKKPATSLLVNSVIRDETQGIVAEITQALPTDIFGIQTMQQGFKKVTDESGATYYTKNVVETKTIQEPLAPSRALITSFVNQKILIITTNPDVVTELSRRLTTNNLFK